MLNVELVLVLLESEFDGSDPEKSDGDDQYDEKSPIVHNSKIVLPDTCKFLSNLMTEVAECNLRHGDYFCDPADRDLVLMPEG